MAKKRKSAPPTRPTVRKRGGDRKRQRLPEELEAFARGDGPLRRPPRKGKPLRDPRMAAVSIPGVSNRDASLVCEQRGRAITEAQGRERGLLLAEAARLAIWRGRSFTGFDAFVEDALGLPLDESRQLLEDQGSPERLPDTVVAVWVRAEAAIIDAGAPATVSYADGEFLVRTNADTAVEALVSIGRRMHALELDRQPRKKSSEVSKPRRSGPSKREDL